MAELAAQFDRKPIAVADTAKESRFEYASPSALATMEQCPRAYAIGRDHTLARMAHPDIRPDNPTYKMKFGTTFHKVVEDHGEQDTLEVAEKVCKDIPPEGWDARYTNPKDVAVGVDNAVATFYASDASAPWQRRNTSTLIEQSFNATINDMGVRGIVDLIDDQGMVTDLKTTTKGRQQWHGNQLTAYWLLAKENGVDVQDNAKVVKIYRPYKPTSDSGVETEHLSARANARHVVRLLAKARWMRDNQRRWQKDYTRIRANPGSSKCQWCVARGTSACPETRTY